MKAWPVVLGVAACAGPASRVPPVEEFPVGSYARCARGLHTPSGNLFPNAAGFEAGAVLTLTRTGTALHSTYVDQNGVTQSLELSLTSGASATLADPGQVLPGFLSICVQDLENNRAYPADLTAGAGMMTAGAGAIFLAVTGGLRSQAGACGTQTDLDARFWLVCDQRRDGEPPAVDPVAAVDSALATGAHACVSQVETYASIDGLHYYVSGGGTGTLTVTADGGSVTATYRDDDAVAGSLQLSATTPITAAAGGQQSLQVPCMAGGGGPTPEPLAVESASLARVDSTLFLSVAGTMAAGSACPGAQVAATLICPR